MSEPSHAHVIALYPGLPQSQSRNTAPLPPSHVAIPPTQTARFSSHLSHSSHSLGPQVQHLLRGQPLEGQTRFCQAAACRGTEHHADHLRRHHKELLEGAVQ